MSHAIPQGMTPPIPGQEKEEPDLWQEDDIPSDGQDIQADEPPDESG